VTKKSEGTLMPTYSEVLNSLLPQSVVDLSSYSLQERRKTSQRTLVESFKVLDLNEAPARMDFDPIISDDLLSLLGLSRKVK
jgi:hypothetical protein